MKKKLIVMLLSCLLMFALASCGETSSESAEPDSVIESIVTETTYESIYADYASKLTDAGAVAVDEFNSEADGITDITKLAELATAKVQNIANVMVVGGTELASLMTKNGDEYSIYEDSYKKLYTVYNDEAMKVYSAYMDKYVEAIPGMTDSLKAQMLYQFESSLESMAPIAEE